MDLFSDDIEQEETSANRRSGRSRTQSRRQRDALDNLTEERAAKVTKRAKASKRAKDRAQHNAAAATVRMNRVTTKLIRRHMGLEGVEHKAEWTDIRSTVREYLRAGHIQWSLGWKEQLALKLGKIYNAIEAEVPALQRFRSSWATEYLAKTSFASHKSYETCKNDGSKYRGKHRRICAQAAAHRKRHTSLVSSSDDEQRESSHKQIDSPRPRSLSAGDESD
ncbi:hypothetical protein BD779DRAFT_1473849 [Infundibulicybe gibba]|nr:hypothetical protein BD779DRAFT_1473849 [Infundibulicybe gibba]